MDLNLLWIPGMALGRALLGWAENAFEDGKIDFPEWRKLLGTVVRMGTPMIALILGLNFDPVVAASLVTVFDFVLVKLYNSRKK